MNMGAGICLAWLVVLVLLVAFVGNGRTDFSRKLKCFQGLNCVCVLEIERRQFCAVTSTLLKMA